MLRYSDILQNVPLFAGISDDDLSTLIGCLSAHVSHYEKGEVIYLVGDNVNCVGVVLEGTVQVVKEDALGNRTIYGEVSSGELFAEVFSCAKVDGIPVSVISASASSVLFIDYRRIVTTCSSTCAFHTRLIENMLAIIANKNLRLNEKIDHISQRSIREKLLSYLSAQAQRAGGACFVIPFNRQELADYLCVDRSALSSELGRMRDEGMVRFERSRFELLV